MNSIKSKSNETNQPLFLKNFQQRTQQDLLDQKINILQLRKIEISKSPVNIDECEIAPKVEQVDSIVSKRYNTRASTQAMTAAVNERVHDDSLDAAENKIPEESRFR
jgi:hypothetical protein